MGLKLHLCSAAFCPADPGGDHPTGCHPALPPASSAGEGALLPCCAWMGTWAGASFTLVWAASGVGNGTPGGAGLTVSSAWVMLSLSPSASLSCSFSLPPSGPRTWFCRRGPSAYIPAPFLPVALELWLQVSITPPIPTPAHPLLGKQLPLFLLLEDGNWKHYEKPKFLAACGWRGPSVLPSPGPSRSVSPSVRPRGPRPQRRPAPGLRAGPSGPLLQEPHCRLCCH